MMFMIAFLSSWLTFGGLWWLISYLHDDHEVGQRAFSPNATEQDKQDYLDHRPCVTDVYDFTTALLFSLETQHTIGYGVRAMTPNCPQAVFLMMFQSICGVIIQCVVAGMVLAKLARPKHRAETIMFSKHAVITMEDGQYCLIFRVGNMRRSQLVGAALHATFVTKRVTQEGEEIPFYQYHLEMTAESEDYDQFIFLSWPIRILHRIDRNSPLWGVSAEQLLREEFEIIVVLEGVVEATGMTTQVRTSYLPGEILWGQRIAPLLTYRKDNGRYEIDYSRFHETTPMDMPDISPKEYYDQQIEQMDKSELESMIGKW